MSNCTIVQKAGKAPTFHFIARKENSFCMEYCIVLNDHIN